MPRNFSRLAEGAQAEWVEAVAGGADLIVCVSTSIEDDLLEWIGRNLAPRPSTQRIGVCTDDGNRQTSSPTSGWSEAAGRLTALIVLTLRCGVRRHIGRKRRRSLGPLASGFVDFRL